MGIAIKKNKLKKKLWEFYTKNTYVVPMKIDKNQKRPKPGKKVKFTVKKMIILEDWSQSP
jgi:hypothetical protein